MVTLEGKVDINLLSSDGNVIAFDKETPIMISVDTPKDTKDTEAVVGTRNSFSITSENCMLDDRTVDYICGLLSPAEYKMPKKKHRKQIRTKKRFKRIQRIILGKYYKC